MTRTTVKVMKMVEKRGKLTKQTKRQVKLAEMTAEMTTGMTTEIARPMIAIMMTRSVSLVIMKKAKLQKAMKSSDFNAI